MLPEVLLTLTSGPRTRICLLVSGVMLADSMGLTLTVRAPAAVEELIVDGASVLEALRLKSSARFATVPWVMTSGCSEASCTARVTWLLGVTSGAIVLPLMMLAAGTVIPPAPLSMTMVAPL